MQIFDTLLVHPIINLLVVFYHALSFINIPFALGFSIILLTVVIRLILYPLTTAQLQMSKKMQELAPQLNKIKEKYKGDMKKQQEATMALYKEHNVNPAAGCLPAVAQIVVLLFGLYPALMKMLTLPQKDIEKVVNGIVYHPQLHLNQAWDTHFFGLVLGKTPEHLLSTVGPAIFIIPVLTGVLQFVQSKMMIPAEEKNKLAVKQKSKAEDFATTFQKQSLYLLPIMVGFFAYYFSVGLSLYWNTFTIFGIIQQYRVSGFGTLQGWIDKLKNK